MVLKPNLKKKQILNVLIFICLAGIMAYGFLASNIIQSMWNSDDAGIPLFYYNILEKGFEVGLHNKLLLSYIFSAISYKVFGLRKATFYMYILITFLSIVFWQSTYLFMIM